jgi:LysM repeat protein
MALKYTVKRGDTLYSLAKKYNTTVQQIMRDNPHIKSADLIYGGNMITIRTPKEALDEAVKKGEKQKTVAEVLNPKSNLTSDEKAVIVKERINDVVDAVLPGSYKPFRDLEPEPASTEDFRYDNIQNFNPLPNLDKDGVHSGYMIDDVQYFDPFHLKTIADPFQTGYAYLFITTPALNVCLNGTSDDELVKTNLKMDSFLNYLHKYEPQILDSLTTLKTNYSVFIRLLTNRLKSFSPSATTSKTHFVGETLSGFKQNLPGFNTESVSADQIQITYHEKQDLAILKLHKAWNDYIQRVVRGDFLPSSRYVEEEMIDYLSSAYFFTLQPDGQTISYFCKYTGLAPISIPYDILAYNQGELNGHIEVTIPYVYSYKEDLDPEIIDEFIAFGQKDVTIKKRKRDDGGSGSKMQYVLSFADYGKVESSQPYNE